MIVRSLLLRHGRLALPKAPSPFRASQWRRCLVTQTNNSAQYTSIPASELPSSVNEQSNYVLDPNDTTVQDYEFFQHQKQHTSKVGGQLEPHYRPHELLSNPPRPQDITLELLLASQSHLGHNTSLWNPANAKYIFGIRGDQDPIHIISLDATAAYLRRACKIVSGVAARGGLILFVGTRSGQARCVVRAAELAQGCHLFDKWTPGTLTNGQQILGRCRKKVVDEQDREVPGFEPQLKYSSAIKPDLVVCLNPLENYTLLHECGIHNIPTIGIIDTDANPTWVTYPIPANDDSLRCVQVIAGALGRAGEAGQAERLAQAKRGIVPYEPRHGLELPTKEEVDAAKRGDEEELEQDEEDEDSVLQEEVEEEAEPDAYALRMAEQQAEAESEQARLEAEWDRFIEPEETGEGNVELNKEALNLLQERKGAEDFAVGPQGIDGDDGEEGGKK